MPKNLKGDSRETPPTTVKELGDAVSPAGEASQAQGPWRRPPQREKRRERWRQYLAAGTLDQDLGHVDDAAQGLDVVALPVADGLGQDLQLQFLPLPHLLTLRLGAQEERQGRRAPRPSSRLSCSAPTSSSDRPASEQRLLHEYRIKSRETHNNQQL